MKIAYATTFDGQDVNNWSGTPHYMSHAFQANHSPLEYIGSLKRHLPRGFKLKQFWKDFAADQRESPRFNVHAAKQYSEQVASKLVGLKTDVVIAPQINPVAYLDCKQPIVLWTDALYASLIGFYPGFSKHSASSIAQGNEVTAACLERAKLAIFSSDWAARSALELYGISADKVKVVPFGANILCEHTTQDIRDMLQARSRDTVKLLFLGKHWDRKGGDIVFRVAKALHQAGQKVLVNFVGCHPPKDVEIPPYIHCHGFISKRTPEGVARITQLLRESHFLFVPSRAEAFGIVFCEASAFGLPSLTSYVGGISTAVRDNFNGKTFALDATPEAYCNYIMNLMQHYSQYEELALSTFNEFTTRLNWDVATQTVTHMIKETL